MELNFEKISTICLVLFVVIWLGYLIINLNDQENLIRVQSNIIRSHKIRLEESEKVLEQEMVLNEDKDKDGLSLREEIKLWTFDTNVDSDGDTVPDKYDEHPIGGDRMIVKYFEWNYFGRKWDIELSIPSDIITYYEQIQRPKYQNNYSYYSEFVDDKGIEIVTDALNDIINEYGEDWDYYNKVMFVVSMVRQIHYTSDILVGFDQFTKFPMQTLNDGTGDCEDMAVLSAAILKNMGYDVKLIYLDMLNQMNHVAIAVFGEEHSGIYFESGGKNYYYIETITEGYGFGEYPSRWNGGNVIIIDID